MNDLVWKIMFVTLLQCSARSLLLDKFHMSDRVSFDNHTNTLDPSQVDPSQLRESLTL